MKMSRWWIVLGALIIQLCLGAIYSWSVFVNPLKEAYAFTTTQTQIIFSVALAVFALVMIFAGRWQDKTGPRKVALTGCILLSIGYILAAFIGSSFAGLMLTIGVIGGAGLGLCRGRAAIRERFLAQTLVLAAQVAEFARRQAALLDIAEDQGVLDLAVPLAA